MATPDAPFASLAALREINSEVIACRRCARLVRWRERVAREKVRRFADEEYWGRPAPGFGDPAARLLLVGLAPAAHGANRTGRMFTGDRSGEWLVRALFRAGFANQPVSLHREDGLVLTDCYITAAARCAPPHNTLLPAEIRKCRPFLLRELALLSRLRVVVGLGAVGFRVALEALAQAGRVSWKRLPVFAHGAEYREDGISVIGSYHPSQQNTFTGRLTMPMFDRVFRLARRRIEEGDRVHG
jgi:uracil-DNA glycosylase family 4